MDFIFEVISEVFIEIYLELMTHFVPEKKMNKTTLKVIAGVEAVLLLVMAIVGVCMLAESNGTSTAGKILLITASVLIVSQMVSGLILIKRKKRKK